MQVNFSLSRDAETGIWQIESSYFPGLTGTAPTYEALISRLPDLIFEWVEDHGFERSDIAIIGKPQISGGLN